MNILYLQNRSKYHSFILSALSKLKENVTAIQIPDSNSSLLENLSGLLGTELIEKVNSCNPDFFFSLDFYPCISQLCQKLYIPYVSWNLSGLYKSMYCNELRNSCNLFFLFDYEMVSYFNQNGVNQVYYMPFGTEIVSMEFPAYTNDITVIASLLPDTEQDAFKKANLLDATYGYIEGLTAAQRTIYGYDFFEQVLPEYILRDLEKNCPPEADANPLMGLRTYYTERFFHPRVTRAERCVAIRALTKAGHVTLYTDDSDFTVEGVDNCGICSSENLNNIIQQSLVNCHFTNRKIRSGISPLAWQILGCGGFLITDFRQEFVEWFDSGKDLIICEDLTEMIGKCIYYQKHTSEREEIALCGHEKVAAGHTWEKRLSSLLQIVSDESDKIRKGSLK